MIRIAVFFLAAMCTFAFCDDEDNTEKKKVADNLEYSEDLVIEDWNSGHGLREMERRGKY